MKDVQNEKDKRNIALQLVGIKDLILPVVIENKNGEPIQITATFSCYTNLPSHQRGTHMSRPAQLLHTLENKPLTLSRRKNITTRIKQSLHAKLATINFTFTYHIKKESPVSKMRSYLSYPCEMQTVSNGIKSTNRTIVHVPVLLLCPCSKAISKQNAHNQRAVITIQVESIHSVFLEDLITIAENAASSPLYTVLKRSDEKFVTERSYANPKFVEDAVRDVALKLRKMKAVTAFTVECESQESIHGHNAYARFSQGRLR